MTSVEEDDTPPGWAQSIPSRSAAAAANSFVSGSYDDEDEVTTHRVSWIKSRWACVAAGLIGIAVILGVCIPMATRSTWAAPSGEPIYPGDSVPYIFQAQVPPSTMTKYQNQFLPILQEAYSKYEGLDVNVVKDEESPQGMAFRWMTGSSDYVHLHRDHARLVQRFALGVFYYSTYAARHDYYRLEHGDPVPGWSSAQNWMSSAHECEWEGIECDDDDKLVIGIYLREHQLTGFLPLELALLSGGLRHLDLTENYLYADGQATVTPFSHLTQVTQLLLNDNYIVTNGQGFPPSLARMTSLHKLALSYNILKGPMEENVFSELSELTHLEAESNFLTGDIPESVARSEEMQNLYLRRNLMEIDLHALLVPPNLPSLFSLWLDNNDITGHIPHTIGNHTDLTSLSITNTSLRGRIPTEFGLLQDLRRVWLYDNHLSGEVPEEIADLDRLEVFEIYNNDMTGSMPEAVCKTIRSSDYEYKELSADCDRIECGSHCCTQCHYDQ